MTKDNIVFQQNDNTSYDRLFRLSAVLYADVGGDKSYNLRLETILNKIIKSVFIEMDNKEMSITDIINFCLDNYSIMLDEGEISKIVNKYNTDDYYVVKGIDNIPRISLKEEKYRLLKSKVQKKSIDYFIDTFISNECSIENVSLNIKDIIYRFLYALYTSNTSSFTKLLECNTDCFNSNSIAIQPKDFSDEEKNIIIRFLNWDNPQKNKAIFDIVSYGIEYCLISSKSDFNNVLGKGIKNKIFYLDTNIIYRALGINGDDRKILTNIFLEKCCKCGVTLKISKYTENEFKRSINFHVKKLSQYKTINIDPKYFENIDVNPGIYMFYHLWRKGRTDTSIEKFKHYIFSQFDSLCDKFNITFDYKPYFDQKNPNDKRILKEYYLSIQIYKKDDEYYEDLEYNENKRYFFDAANVLLVEKARGSKHCRFLDTKHFIISSDQALRKWDFERESTPPIVLLPTHWLSIVLRYTGRSEVTIKVL